MSKQEAATLQAWCAAEKTARDRARRISAFNLSAALADRAALIEALRPFAADAGFLLHRIPAFTVNREAARVLLESMGELE